MVDTSTGKKAFRYQCEGFEPSSLPGLLKGRRLVGYELPAGHSLTAAWELSLVFDCDLVLQFSSASAEAVGWQEVGSLNVRLVQRSEEDGGATTERTTTVPVSPVSLIGAEKLVYEDDDVLVECGLVLCASDGQDVVVAAGIPPGSVSVEAPFSGGLPFAPQFPVVMCRRNSLV